MLITSFFLLFIGFK